MLKELIYQHFDKIRLEKDQKEIQSEFNVSPSSLTDCCRKIYYKKTRTLQSNPIESHSYIKFELGHATHEKLAEILKKCFDKIEFEISGNKEYLGLRWIYFVDAIAVLENKKVIFEFKSKYSNGIDAVKEKPEVDDVLQLYSYMRLEGIDEGYLLYIGRDNGYMYEYHFTMESLKEFETIFLQRINKMLMLKTLFTTRSLPDRDFNIVIKKDKNNELHYDFQKDNIKYKSSWRCGYCTWKDLCWKEVLDQMKEYNFYIDNNFIK
jgi:hypothetical protein